MTRRTKEVPEILRVNKEVYSLIWIWLS